MMKHTNRTFPISLFAFASVALFWPQMAQAQAATSLKAPQDVSLDILECSQTADSNATLSWEKQTGATEYRVYTRLGEDEFGAYEATTSAKIKLPLDSKDISIIAITSAEKTQVNGKTVVNESDKSPEFEVDVAKLCQKTTPTTSVTPEPTKESVTVTLTPTNEEAQEPVVNQNPTLIEEPTVSPTDENLVKLEQKYADSKKNQAQIEKKVQSFVSWVKSKIFFFK